MTFLDALRASFMKWIRDDGYLVLSAVTEIEWDDEGMPVYYTLADGKRHYLDGEWHAWQAAIAAEREAAAKVCDERAKQHRETHTDDLGESYQLGHAADEATACATAIRARGAS